MNGAIREQNKTEAKPTVGLYLDSPRNDGDELEKPDSQVFCVPAAKSSGGDLICLVLHRQRPEDGETGQRVLYRRVGLTTIPVFLPDDQWTVFEQASNEVLIRII